MKIVLDMIESFKILFTTDKVIKICRDFDFGIYVNRHLLLYFCSKTSIIWSSLFYSLSLFLLLFVMGINTRLFFTSICSCLRCIMFRYHYGVGKKQYLIPWEAGGLNLPMIMTIYGINSLHFDRI